MGVRDTSLYATQKKAIKTEKEKQKVNQNNKIMEKVLAMYGPELVGKVKLIFTWSIRKKLCYFFFLIQSLVQDIDFCDRKMFYYWRSPELEK